MSDFFDSSLVLKLKPFKQSAASLLKELSDTKTLEQEFLVDPAGYLASRLHGRAAAKIPQAKLNAANRFLYSIISNKEFFQWLEAYQSEAGDRISSDPHFVVNKAKIRRDLAEAMIRFGDAEIIDAVLPGRFKLGDMVDPWDVMDLVGDIGGRPVAVQMVASELALSQTVIGYPGRMADVAVEIETLIYAVAAAAVFVVVVAAVGAVARHPEQMLFQDFAIDRREMAYIAESLVRAGSELRVKGLI